MQAMRCIVETDRRCHHASGDTQSESSKQYQPHVARSLRFSWQSS